MTTERIPTLYDAILTLAGRCDYASSLDGVGFNGADAPLGHDLAAIPYEGWTPGQRKAAYRMIQKYHKQLSGAGIDLAQIPEPTTPVNARLGGTCATCGLKFPAGTLVVFGEDKKRSHAQCPTPGSIPETPQRPEAGSAPTTPPTEPGGDDSPLKGADNPSGYGSRQVLGPGGVISEKLPGYEHRDAQLAGADLVEQAIANERHAVIEAGTGTGKSLMYLVPAILSGKQTIVSTGDKALQAQIVGKDIPFLQGVMPVPVTAAKLTGRSNYVCLEQVDEITGGGQGNLGGEFLFRSPEAAAAFAGFQEWLDTTETGELESADFPIPWDLAVDVTVDSDGCLGEKCPRFTDCFAEQAKKRARDAQVVIVNHALLLRAINLAHDTDGHVEILGKRQVVAIDEAHRLEETATDAFGVEVTEGRWNRMARRLTRYTTDHPAIRPKGETDPQRIRATDWKLRVEYVEGLLATLLSDLTDRLEASKTQAQRLGDETRVGDRLVRALSDLALAVGDGGPDWLAPKEREGWRKLGGQVEKLGNDLSLIITPGTEDNWVRYAELEGGNGKRRLVLHAKPIDVSGHLRDRLWSPYPSVISTSATLATGNDFGYWKRRVGLHDSLDLVVGSPFDFPHQSMIYLPSSGKDFDPSRFRQDGSVEYLDRLAGEIERLLLASDGRGFVLFTSLRTMDQVYDRLAPRLKWLTLKQGEMPRPELIRRFKEDGRAVLFGVKSFWEGVDVQGEALSLVVIDKLPFNPPGDPVWDAKCDRVNRQALARGVPPKQADWAWWRELAIPTAIIALKQGFGRLIRTKSDRGVVALLDGRLSTKGYGPEILRALPPATQTRSLPAVKAFFETH